MNVRQCKKCGNLYQSFDGSVCPVCAEKLDQAFILVRDYIYKHPDASIFEISKQTEIDEKTILQFLKEERLSINGSNSILTCEKCGASISTGRYCKGCLEMFNRALDSVTPAKVAEPKMVESVRKEKMYIRHN